MPPSALESKPWLGAAWMRGRFVCPVTVVAGVVVSSCNARPSCPPLSPPEPMPESLSAFRAPVVDPPPAQPLPVRICDVEPDSPQCLALRPDEPLLPRCRPDDPKCGPEFWDPTRYGLPAWRGPHGEGGDQCYRPEAPRHSGLAPRDRCAWDGECRVGPCGLCVSYRRSVALCSERMDVGQPPAPVPPTWCGCVDGGCAFFRQ
jgi:hypothetical protein